MLGIDFQLSAPPLRPPSQNKKMFSFFFQPDTVFLFFEKRDFDFSLFDGRFKTRCHVPGDVGIFERANITQRRASSILTHNNFEKLFQNERPLLSQLARLPPPFLFPNQNIFKLVKHVVHLFLVRSNLFANIARHIASNVVKHPAQGNVH